MSILLFIATEIEKRPEFEWHNIRGVDRDGLTVIKAESDECVRAILNDSRADRNTTVLKLFEKEIQNETFTRPMVKPFSVLRGNELHVLLISVLPVESERFKVVTEYAVVTGVMTT